MIYTALPNFIVDLNEINAHFNKDDLMFLDDSYAIGLAPSAAIEDRLNADVNASFAGYSFIPAGQVLGAHFDEHRNSVINIPVFGDFDVAPLIFLDEHDAEIASFNYPSPAIMDVQKYKHYVDNTNGPDRLILSIGMLESYQSLVDLHQADNLIK